MIIIPIRAITALQAALNTESGGQERTQRRCLSSLGFPVDWLFEKPPFPDPFKDQLE